jgi:hypothetical protein
MAARQGPGAGGAPPPNPPPPQPNNPPAPPQARVQNPAAGAAGAAGQANPGAAIFNIDPGLAVGSAPKHSNEIWKIPEKIDEV